MLAASRIACSSFVSSELMWTLYYYTCCLFSGSMLFLLSGFSPVPTLVNDLENRLRGRRRVASARYWRKILDAFPEPVAVLGTATPASAIRVPSASITAAIASDASAQPHLKLIVVGSAGGLLCPMPTCLARLAPTDGARRGHFRAAHHAELCMFPHGACAGKCKVRYPLWDGKCEHDRGMSVESLGRHVLNVHIGLAHRFPVCGREGGRCGGTRLVSGISTLAQSGASVERERAWRGDDKVGTNGKEERSKTNLDLATVPSMRIPTDDICCYNEEPVACLLTM